MAFIDDWKEDNWTANVRRGNKHNSLHFMKASNFDSNSDNEREMLPLLPFSPEYINRRRLQRTDPDAATAKATADKFHIQIKRQRDFSRQTHDDDNIFQVSRKMR